MAKRDIIHVDIDAFLASVEQVRDPALRGKPVVVGGERGDRGLVLSSSYAARRRGVVPGLTLSQAARLLPEAIFLRGDSRHASRLSERVWDVCRRHTPLVEATSIDDCYLDVTGTDRLFGAAAAVAERIRRQVGREIGLSLSLGVGGNRTVARVATVFAKPGKVAEVPRGGEAAFLAPLPVRRLPGVGRRTETALHRYNVRTIGELARIPRWILIQAFGEAAGRLLFDRARGVDDDPVRPGRGPRSVSRETSFDPVTADRDVIEGMLYYLLERAAAALRESGLSAKTVAVKIRYVDGPGDTRARTLEAPTDREREIWPEARGLLGRMLTRRARLANLGVALTGLTGERSRQAGLFGEEEHRRAGRLTDGIEGIRRRFGFGAIQAGRSISLIGRLPRTAHGFVLKTPSLAK